MPEDVAHPPVEVWPCCVQAVNVFGGLTTQWRMGPAGPTGLDYAALEPALRLMAVPTDDWPALFEDVQTMERAALEEMRREHA
jgi:hypothetical protein